jgi:hypothetical protein
MFLTRRFLTVDRFPRVLGREILSSTLPMLALALPTMYLHFATRLQPGQAMTPPKNRRSVIKDLLALYQRYSAEEIEQAVDSLKSGEALREFTDLTLDVIRRTERASANRPPRAISSKKKSRRDYFEELIAEIESKSDPTLTDLVELLKSASKGVVLNDGRSLRQLGARLNIPEGGKKTDRFASLKQIGEALLAKPPEERADLVELARRLESRPSSLQGWSDLIVKK